MTAKDVVDLVTGVAWPLIVLVLAAWILVKYGKQIGDFFERAITWKFGPVEMTAQAKEEIKSEYVSQLEASNKDLQESLDKAFAERSAEAHERREQIESVIQEAAEWGWRRSALSPGEPPRVSVAWENDRPIVRDSVSDRQLQEAVDLLADWAGNDRGADFFMHEPSGRVLPVQVKYRRQPIPRKGTQGSGVYWGLPNPAAGDDEDGDPPAGVPAKA